MRFFRLAILLAAGAAVLPGSAGVLISTKGTPAPGGEPPFSGFVFHDIGADSGTSGSCTDADQDGLHGCTMSCKGQPDVTEGCMLYLPLQGDGQVIGKFDGFVGTTHDFSAAWAGIAEDTGQLAKWGRVTKHARGRITAKYRPVAGEETLESIVGDDTDTESCLAVTNDVSLATVSFWKAPATQNCDAETSTWELIGQPDSFQLSNDVLGALGCVSNDDAVLLTCNFSEVSITNEITIEGAIAPPPPVGDTQCDDGDDNDGDGDIDLDDVDCKNASDDNEAPEIAPPPFGSGTDLTNAGTWVAADDNVDGWNFTHPASRSTPVTFSGIYNFNSDVPPNFPGRHMKEINWEWRDVEPTQGNYNFQPLKDAINDPNYDGTMLNFRGFVWQIEQPAGSGTLLANKRSAPDWLSGATKVQEGVKHNFRITNVKIDVSAVRTPFLNMIEAFGNAGIPAMPKLTGAILHGVSHTKGEEWGGSQTQSGEDVMFEYIGAWTDAYGANAKKLMWMKPIPARLYNKAIAGEAGSRDGIVKRWLTGTLMDPAIGQVFNPTTGYITVDETINEIAEGRAFLGQNEIYQSSNSAAASYGPEEFWPLRYRMANFRALQMRRNMLWTDKDSRMNPPMLNWVSLQLGHFKANTAPEAWAVLMRTWIRHSGSTKELNNFERFAYQRESQGATTPTLTRQHGFDATGTANLIPVDLRETELARRGASIGIGIEADFMQGGPHNGKIFVTYQDITPAQWTLEYDNGPGVTVKTVAETQNTGRLRTQGFCVNNLHTDAVDEPADITLKSTGAVDPFLFVRVVKTTAGCN